MGTECQRCHFLFGRLVYVRSKLEQPRCRMITHPARTFFAEKAMEYARSIECRIAALERSTSRWRLLAVVLLTSIIGKLFIFAGPPADNAGNKIDHLAVGTLTANHVLVTDDSGLGGKVILSADKQTSNLVLMGYRESADHSRQFVGSECSIITSPSACTFMLLTPSRDGIADPDELAKNPEGIEMLASQTASTLTVTRAGEATGFVLPRNKQDRRVP